MASSCQADVPWSILNCLCGSTCPRPNSQLHCQHHQHCRTHHRISRITSIAYITKTSLPWSLEGFRHPACQAESARRRRSNRLASLVSWLVSPFSGSLQAGRQHCARISDLRSNLTSFTLTQQGYVETPWATPVGSCRPRLSAAAGLSALGWLDLHPTGEAL